MYLDKPTLLNYSGDSTVLILSLCNNSDLLFRCLIAVDEKQRIEEGAGKVNDDDNTAPDSSEVVDHVRVVDDEVDGCQGPNGNETAPSLECLTANYCISVYTNIQDHYTESYGCDDEFDNLNKDSYSNDLF